MTSRNQKNFEFKLGKQGLLLFIAGMSLLLFVVFILGVMVGTHIDAYPERIAQSIPNIIRRQLPYPASKTDKIPLGRDELKPAAASEENSAAGTPPPDLTAKTVLPSPVNSETGEQQTLSVPLQTEQEGMAKKRWNSAVQKTVTAPKPPVNVSLPAAEKEAVNVSRPPDAAAVPAGPSPKTGGEYLVQAGSFQSRQKAKQFSDKFTPLGYKPRVVMVDLPKKGKWFRVVIGGFATKDEALKAVGLLSKKIKGINYVVHPDNQRKNSQ